MDAGPALSHLRQLAAGADVSLSAEEQQLLLARRRDSLAQVATPDEQQALHPDCASALGALRRLAVRPLDVAGSRLEEPHVAVILRFREATCLRSQRGPRTGELPPLPGLAVVEPTAIAVRKEREAISRLTVEAAAARTIRMAAERPQPGGRQKAAQAAGPGTSKSGSVQPAAKKTTRDASAAPSRHERRPTEEKKRGSGAVRDPKVVPSTSKDAKRPKHTSTHAPAGAPPAPSAQNGIEVSKPRRTVGLLIPKKVSTEPPLAPVVVSDIDLQDGTAAPDGSTVALGPVLAASAGLQPVAASDPRRVADPRLAMHGGGPALGGPAAPLSCVDATVQPAATTPDLDALREMLRLLAQQQAQQQLQQGAP